jgi:hypothetical protein
MTVQVRARNLKLMVFIVFVTLVISIATATIVQRNTHNVESVQASVDHLEDSVDSVKESTDHLEEVAAGIEEQTPEEQARNAAIGKAVALVPDIHDILCDAFPDVPACQVPPPGG